MRTRYSFCMSGTKASTAQLRVVLTRYYQEADFDALKILRPITQNNGLTEIECTLGCLSHHSQLKNENGDGAVIGSSSLKQRRENMEAMKNGSLPEEVVDALNQG